MKSVDQTKEIMKTTNTVIKTKFIDWYYQWVWITWIPKSIPQKTQTFHVTHRTTQKTLNLLLINLGTSPGHYVKKINLLMKQGSEFTALDYKNIFLSTKKKSADQIK